MAVRSVVVFGLVLLGAAAAAAGPAPGPASGPAPGPASGPAPAPAPDPAPDPTPAQPVNEKGPAEMWEPMTEAMQRLGLTDLQRRILSQVFHEYEFERPGPAADDAPLAVQVEPTVSGGLYRLGPGGDLPVRLTVRLRARGAPAAIELRYLVQDFYGRKVAGGTLPRVFPDASGRATADLVVGEATVFGYYHVLVTAACEGRTATGACGIVVVHPPAKGLSPESAFGVTLAPGRRPETVLPAVRRLGARHLAFDWTGDPSEVEAVREAGLAPVPIVPIRIPQRRPAPPVFAATTAEAIAPLAETAPGWHLGREPVLDRDSLAEAVASYRRTLSGLIEAVRRGGSPVGLSVGTTPAVLADVLTEGPVLAGADGVALHVGAEAGSLRSGAFRRMLDLGVQTARRMGLTRADLVTPAEEAGAGSPQRGAWNLVTRQVAALEVGADRVFVQWARDVPRSSAAAYAWMTHLLGDTRYEGDAWAEVPLLEGHIFAAPDRRVAVVWSWVGEGVGPCDRGVLVFERGLGLQAVDVVGHPVGIWKGERLIVPIGDAPVYLVSVDLSAGALRERLRGARIIGIAPATVRIESIIRGRMPGRVKVTLWVQSHRPEKLVGRAGLLAPEGWAVRGGDRRFDLEPGEADEVTFECDVAEASGPGPFPMEAVVSLDEEFVRHKQAVWVAQTPRRTIEVGFGLADWDGIAPVVLEAPGGEVWAEVRTAWDPECFYVSASVRRERPTFRSGAFAFEGDAVQLAWGARERADDDFGHPARGWALPEGAFRDTHHLMALTFGADGARVVRLRGPHITLRAHVPGNLDPWCGPVEGAEVVIARDDAIGHTVFEAAVPWKELAPLDGGEGRIFRFGIRVGNGDGPPMDWAREAGVPAFLSNPCSFLPLSSPTLPCQTWWGMVGERGNGE